MQTKMSEKFTIVREVPASRQEVFDAWTQPEQLKKWWKPNDNKLVDVTNDVVENGIISYSFESSLKISGKYIEVDPPNRLKYEWNWEFPDAKNGAYTLTVVFKESENATIVEVVQEANQQDEGTYPHEEGWEKGLDDLIGYFNGNDTVSSNNQMVVQGATGHNEAPEQVKVGGENP